MTMRKNTRKTEYLKIFRSFFSLWVSFSASLRPLAPEFRLHHPREFRSRGSCGSAGGRKRGP